MRFRWCKNQRVGMGIGGVMAVISEFVKNLSFFFFFVEMRCVQKMMNGNVVG
jgi:hypothetical protein